MVVLKMPSELKLLRNSYSSDDIEDDQYQQVLFHKEFRA